MNEIEVPKKYQKYWVEKSLTTGKPLFLFINPESDGSGTLIFNILGNKKDKVRVYVNNCNNITPVEYVTYKLLGYLD